MKVTKENNKLLQRVEIEGIVQKEKGAKAGNKIIVAMIVMESGKELLTVVTVK